MKIFGIEIKKIGSQVEGTKAATFAPRESKPLQTYPSRIPLFQSNYKPSTAYVENPFLRAVIDYDAGMFANADVFEQNSAGERIENSKAINSLKSIANPSFNGMLRQVRKDVNLSGFYIARILRNSAGVIFEITRFNPETTIIYTRKKDKFNYEIHYIQSYYNAESIRLSGSELNDIFIFSENEPESLGNIMRFNSKINTLKNIVESSDALHEGLKNTNKFRGAQYIISPPAGSTTDVMPIAPNLQDSLSDSNRKLYSEYNRAMGTSDGQSGIMFTSVPIDAHKMSSPLIEMDIAVQSDLTLDVICNIIGIDPVLFSRQGKFENFTVAQKSHYENNIQPFSDAFFQSYSAFLFGAMSANRQIVADYSYLDVFQEDLEKNRAVTEKTVLLSVALNTAVFNQYMDYNTAVETLVYGGVDVETAKKMIKR